MVDWVTIADGFLRAEQPLAVERPRKRYERYLEAPDALAKGHSTIDAIRRTGALLDACFMQRTYIQIQAWELFLSCFSALIYGEALEENQVDIVERNGWQNVKTDAAIAAPRRMGKSVVMALLLASVSVHVPNLKVAIFAASARQGDKDDGMISLIIGALKCIGVTIFDKKSQEHLFFTINGNQRQFRSYPGGTDK
jgi:hypothetical protein